MSTTLKRLPPGQLDSLVLTYFSMHKDEGPLTATDIARGLGGRSVGAVANCLSRLAEGKKICEVEKHPRRFVIKKTRSRKERQQ
jgi:hypothetical protein